MNPVRLSVFLKSVGLKPTINVDANIVQTMVGCKDHTCRLLLVDRHGTVIGPPVKFPNGTILVALEKPLP